MVPVRSIAALETPNDTLTALGIGPIPSIYFSEAFPLSHRELGAAFTICVNNIVGSVLSLSFPSILATMTATGGMCPTKVLLKERIANIRPQHSDFTLRSICSLLCLYFSLYQRPCGFSSREISFIQN